MGARSDPGRAGFFGGALPPTLPGALCSPPQQTEAAGTSPNSGSPELCLTTPGVPRGFWGFGGWEPLSLGQGAGRTPVATGAVAKCRP